MQTNAKVKENLDMREARRSVVLGNGRNWMGLASACKRNGLKAEAGFALFVHLATVEETQHPHMRPPFHSSIEFRAVMEVIRRFAYHDAYDMGALCRIAGLAAVHLDALANEREGATGLQNNLYPVMYADEADRIRSAISEIRRGPGELRRLKRMLRIPDRPVDPSMTVGLRP